MSSNHELSPNKIRRWLWISLVVVLTAFLIVGIQWATYARPPLADSLEALESDEFVRIETEPWLTFIPLENEPSTGLIFYPGGRIDPRGYAALLRPIAAEGFLVVVPSMPLNMAVFNSNAAQKIIDAYSGIASWAIAGHSVGGVAAALFTSNHPDQIDALALWASYPANSSDLSQSLIPVYSIFGELDPQATPEAVHERAHLLPADSIYVEIAGGDHHQFGSYRIEPEDALANISAAEQHLQIVQATLELLAAASDYDGNE